MIISHAADLAMQRTRSGMWLLLLHFNQRKNERTKKPCENA